MRRVAMWIGISLALLVGAEPVRAELEWETVAFKPKVQKALVDCRSITFAHESRVPLSTEWKAVGHTFLFAARSNGVYIVDVTDAEGKTKKRTLGEKPGLIPLDAFDVKYALAWRPAPEADAVWVASAYGAEIKIAGGTGYLVDSNMNGTFNESGNGYVAPESRTVAPWRGDVWTIDAAFITRFTESGDWEWAAYPMPKKSDLGHAKAWRLLQWRRQQCGLLTVSYKFDLEAAMRAHCAYCFQNRYQGHDEDTEKDGYSEAGALAGKQSVLGFGVRGTLAGMEEQLATLYHRTGLLQPALTHTAMVAFQGVFAANVQDSKGGPLKDAVLLYPPHGMSNVPCKFNEGGEIPMPTANQDTMLHNLGTPVGLFTGALEQAESLAEKPKLKLTALEGRKRSPGKIFRRNVKYPGNPPGEAVPASNFGNVAIVPSEPLQRGMTYLCEIQLVLPETGVTMSIEKTAPFVLQWEFTTGK